MIREISNQIRTLNKLIINNFNKIVIFFMLLFCQNTSFSNVQGVWGNIVKIDDFGSVSQRSIAGFRIDNSASPFEINYLGSSNNSVQFNKIPNNFVTPDGAEHTFDNRFNNLFMNETNTTSGDVIEAQAFFQICPPQYGDKCVYFKIVSQHQDYGYYYAAEAPKKHQLDFDGYIKNLTTGTGVGLAAGLSIFVGLSSIAAGIYNLKRINSYQKQLEDLKYEFNSLKLDLDFEMEKKTQKISDLQNLKTQYLYVQETFDEIQLNISEMKKIKSSTWSGDDQKSTLFKSTKSNELSNDLFKKFQHAETQLNYLKDSIKRHENKIGSLGESIEKNTQHMHNISTNRIKLESKISKKGFGKLLNSKYASSILTLVGVPVLMSYYGLLMGTRGTHQGLWSTDFMAYSLQPITQDDIKTYKFIPAEAMNTHFEVIENSTAAESIRLSFSGDGIDNQPLVEITLSLLSNVWNPAIIRDAQSGDWGEDQYRGVLKKEERWDSKKTVYWESTAALLLAFKSFNELDFTHMFQSEKEARTITGSGTSNLFVFSSPELYPTNLPDNIFREINMNQDQRSMDKNADKFARSYQLESISLKNNGYAKILINPDLNDNGISFNSSNLYADLVDEDSDYNLHLLTTRDKATFEKWTRHNSSAEDKNQLQGVYLDTDCYSIKDNETCPLNIGITGIDYPFVGALYIAENNSYMVRIPVFINTDIAVKTLVIPFDKTFNEGEPFYVVLENLSDHRVDDLSLALPEGLRVDANYSSCLKEIGAAKGLCEFVVYGAENLTVGDHKIDVLIDQSHFKTILLQVEE